MMVHCQHGGMDEGITFFNGRAGTLKVFFAISMANSSWFAALQYVKSFSILYVCILIATQVSKDIRFKVLLDESWALFHKHHV